MSYYEDAPRTLWSSSRKVAKASKDHTDGCMFCDRVIRRGQSYVRFVGMTDEDTKPTAHKFHTACLPSGAML